MRSCILLAFSSGALLVASVAVGAESASLAGRLSGGTRPLPGCAVTLYRLEKQRAAEAIVTVTGPDGYYKVGGLAPGDYVVLATCSGQRVFQGLETIAASAMVKDIRLTLDGSVRKVSLARIKVREDGSPSVTGWSFDVFNGDRKLFSLPKSDYDDRAGHNDVTVKDTTADVFVPTGATLTLRVEGKRTFGAHDTARGETKVGTAPGPVSCEVVETRDPKKGAFTFVFNVD